ncbi:hypothetical protein [Paenibacillus sp. Soil522]|uniref:hypothetical protein n=1 Tax=Paenibacillus sp. Soil522 TaxID=1736388 RepID=UPI0006FA64FA|nr:hypothetical protein [Paenibacillus sp. Soil522]KRE51161.1 hypothetical protein ASG81_03060 [Paenibacillus sp. Soil522]
MNNKNRITYRFDRNGKSMYEENRSTDKQQESPAGNDVTHAAPNNNIANKPAKMNVIPLYPSTEQHSISEISPWNSPFQEDIGALEQLIRNTDTIPVSAAPTKQIDKTKSSKTALMEVPSELEDNRAAGEHSYFKAEDVQDPLQTDKDERVFDEPSRNKLHYSRIKRREGAPSWFNVFLSVAAALATGALFGYLLLSLFTGASIWPGGSGEKPDSESVAGNINTGETSSGANVSGSKNGDGTLPESDNHSDKKPDSNSAMVSLKGLDRSYYLLQFGVFSNTEGRDTALVQLEEKGLAGAAMPSAADYRVYAGMAGDRSKAQTIRELMPDLDLYIKEVSILTPAQMPFEGDQAAAQTFFEQTEDLVQMLDELAIAQLEQPALSSTSEAAAASWQAEHQKWTENAATMRIGIMDTEGKAYLEKVIHAINSAAKSMVEYDKKPSRAHLWSTQTQLMKAIIAQKEWFETISAL